MIFGAFVFAAAFAAATPGWEDVNPSRREFPVVAPVWKADWMDKSSFSFELRDGALGTVEISGAGLHIVKTNDAGSIVVKAKPFRFTKGCVVRFIADHAVKDADVDFSTGVLRYHGAKETHLGLQPKAESLASWYRGQPTATALCCTATGVTFRKYAHYIAEDDVVTPVIVVKGVKSDSLWTNWEAEDYEVAQKEWKKKQDRRLRKDHLADAITDKELDARLEADFDHVAEIKKIDGVSRTVLDGEIVAPAVFRGAPGWRYHIDRGRCGFGAHKLNGSAMRLMVATSYPWIGGESITNRYEIAPMVAEVRRAMRLAPDACFIVGICVTAPYDFIGKEHPEEAWIDEKGNPVYGTVNSSISGFNYSNEKFKRNAFQWPSFSSRVWRSWANGWIRDFVAELKRQGLAKRVVGAHIFGYHDQQMTQCFTDYSRPAQEEYRRIIAEPECLTTNYAFCVRLAGQRALDEFAGTFKAALGKPAIVVRWCESPFRGSRGASTDLTAFLYSKNTDVMVCQPGYRDRYPGFPDFYGIPFDSLHLHGKTFWNELDLRTYNSPYSLRSAPHSKHYGMAMDLPMWKTMYRKFAGEADATRTGYWLYDMSGEWYDAPEIAADIRALAAEEEMLVREKPSKWRPDAAFVIDEASLIYGDKPLLRTRLSDDFIVNDQYRYLGSAGVPFESYVAEDVLRHPHILDGKKVVVFAFMREIDARRKSLLECLARQGTTLVFLSETGVLGMCRSGILGGKGVGDHVSGESAVEVARVIGFEPELRLGDFGRKIVAEPGMTDMVTGQMAMMISRERSSDNVPTGPRCTVRETEGVRVLARYASDGLPALAERQYGGCRRLYVCEPSGLTPQLFNRIARESGAYCCTDGTGLQISMNGNFVSVHCLRPGCYRFRLPFPCRVVNMKDGSEPVVADGAFMLDLKAGTTCRFRLYSSDEPANMDFQAGASGWRFPKTLWRLSDGEGRNGSTGLVWENSDPGSLNFPLQRLAFVPGGIYRYGAWVKIDTLKDEGGRRPRPEVAIVCANANGEWGRAEKAYPVGRPDAAGWVRYEGVAGPLAADTVHGNFFCRLPRGATGRVRFDDFSFSREDVRWVDVVVSSAYRDTAENGPVRFVATVFLGPSKAPVDSLSPVFVFRGADGAEHEILPDEFDSAHAAVTFDAERLASGTHPVSFVLRMKDGGRELGRASCLFTRAAVRRRVSFDGYGRTLVDGKPFFPLGMYAHDVTPEVLARYTNDTPYNCIMPYHAPSAEMLDVCMYANLMVVYSVQSFVYGRKMYGDRFRTREDSFRHIAGLVRVAKDHPAVLAWYTNDESPTSQTGTLRDLRTMIHSLDPDHPVWHVMDYSRAIRAFLGAYDVVGMDPYPVGLQGAQADIGRASGCVLNVRNGSFGTVPVWHVPQAFDWAWDNRGKSNLHRFPTEEEISSMTWQPIAAGANGLFYYAFHRICNGARPAERDEYLRRTARVAAEVKERMPILLSDPGPKVESAPKGSICRTWRLAGGRVVLLVANSTRRDVTGTVVLSELPSQPVNIPQLGHVFVFPRLSSVDGR